MRVLASVIATAAAALAAMAFLHAGQEGSFAAAAPVASRALLTQTDAVPVDTELVLAVDVSNSMDPQEQELQREGYVTGLTSPEFLSALRGGSQGKVAVTYFEWAGLHDQKIILPWRLIEGRQSAEAVANEIARAPYRRAPRTSIYGALQFARPLFDGSGYQGLRRVIDVSGDGVNNMGPPVTLMRDDVLGGGIVINGLPIMLQRPGTYGMWGQAFAHLDIYYEDCVTGGPGSFVMTINRREQFKEATRNKLVQEIAGGRPAPRLWPAQAGAPRVHCS